MPLYRDPIQGLIQYVKDIKPFHTKLIDVVVTYAYEERVNATILDNLNTTIDMDMDYSRDPCSFGYDTDGYDFIPYEIPKYDYAINHSNAYNFDCTLPGCERHYKTTTIAVITQDTLLVLPFNYLYGVETLYCYVNGVLSKQIFEQVASKYANTIDATDVEQLNTNRVRCLIDLPSGVKILISTHAIGIDNECWSDLASSGFESHTFGEHDFDLTDPDFDIWPYGFDGPRIDTHTYDIPDPATDNRDCKCPPYEPYASPTSVISAISEKVNFTEIMTFTDMIDVAVYDWSGKWANGFDSTPYNEYSFDITSLWDVVPDAGYNFSVNFGSFGRPDLIETNFTIQDTHYNSVGVKITGEYSSTVVDSSIIGTGDGFTSTTNKLFTSATITEIFDIVEYIDFKDIVGVNIVDPCTTSGWEMDWGQDDFWYDMLPDQSGWDTNPLWDDNHASWLQLPTVGGYECDNLGFGEGEWDSDQIWSCIPCSLVGGFDDSMGFDILEYEYNPLWNSYPILPYTGKDTDYVHGCLPKIQTDSIITIVRSGYENMAYIYYQKTLSTTWVITHNLFRFPIIRIFNYEGVEIYPISIEHLSETTARITFGQPTAGIIRFV